MLLERWRSTMNLQMVRTRMNQICCFSCGDGDYHLSSASLPTGTGQLVGTSLLTGPGEISCLSVVGRVIGSLIFPKKEHRQEHISELQPQNRDHYVILLITLFHMVEASPRGVMFPKDL